MSGKTVKPYGVSITVACTCGAWLEVAEIRARRVHRLKVEPCSSCVQEEREDAVRTYREERRKR